MNRHDDIIRGSIRVPLTFEVYPLSSNSKLLDPVSITITKSLQNIDTSILLDDILVNYPLIFKLQDNIAQLLLAPENGYFLGEVKEKPNDKYTYNCLIYHVFGSLFALSRLPKDTDSNAIESKVTFTDLDMINEEDILKKLSFIPDLQEVTDVSTKEVKHSFSMKAPTHLDNNKSNSSILLSPHSNDDPCKFLKSRYYNLLYSLNTPLTYFPKTGLSRFRVLCNDSEEKIKTVLQNLCISIDTLDERYKSRLGVLRFSLQTDDNNASLTIDDIEINNQIEFLQKYPEIQLKLKDNKEDSKEESKFIEKLNTIVLELKIREAQLQMIIILELIYSWNLSENEIFELIQKQEINAMKKKLKQKKHSLIRKKSSKKIRKIIPTFLGMGMSVENPDSDSLDSNEMDLFDLFNNLNTYIDRIRLWDTLLGRNSESKDDNLYGFLGYVLLPYYNKKLPKFLKHIISRVKSMNVKSGNKQKPKEAVDSPSNAGQHPKENKGTSNEKVAKNRPSLKRKAFSISNSQDLLPAFTLKRSKSNISSKNLQKRQVDMSINLKSFSEGQLQPEKASLKHTSEPIKAPKQKYSEIRQENQEKSSISISQVEATPVKKKTSSIKNDWNDPSHGNERVFSEKRTAGGYELSNKNISLNEKLLSALHDHQSEVVLSPTRNSGNNANATYSPLNNIHNPILTTSETPKQSIHSSPFSIRSSSKRVDRRPGAHGSIQDSPCYSALLLEAQVLIEGKQDFHNKLKQLNSPLDMTVNENHDEIIYSPTQLKKRK